MERKIAAVGDKDTVLALKAVGCDVVVATGAEDIKKAILDLEKKSYSLIFIPEIEAIKVEAFLRTFDAKPYPVILSIPDGRESGGFAVAKLTQNMLRAIGSSAALK